MNFLELSQKRHSVRGYRNTPIEDEKLAYVLECARLSQSAANFQPWLLYVVRGGEVKDTVCKAYPAKWMAEAPVLIVICTDKKQAWVRHYDNKSHTDIDGSIITENICLAAAEQGLGTCWIGHFDPVLVSETLKLPENLEPMAIITLGYSSSDEIPPKKRKSLEEIVRFI